MSQRLQHHRVLALTCLGDAATTSIAYYVLGLPEAGLLPRLLLPVIGPAYFVLQYVIMYLVIECLTRHVSDYAAYPILLVQAFAVGNNLGWVVRAWLS